MWQQFIEPGEGKLADAREHIAKPGERIDLHQLAGSYKAAEDSRGPAAAIAAEEGPVGAAHGEAAQGALGVIVVDR